MEQFMKAALKEAQKAAKKGEVPVGAVVVREGKILARAHNLRQSTHNPVAHAEVLALQKASKKMGTWHLEDCTLYVTLEPCPMCAGACVNARLGKLVYGAADLRFGGCETLYRIPQDERLNHRCETVGGVLAEECAGLLSQFFQGRRRDKKEKAANPTVPNEESR